MFIIKNRKYFNKNNIIIILSLLIISSVILSINSYGQLFGENKSSDIGNAPSYQISQDGHTWYVKPIYQYINPVKFYDYDIDTKSGHTPFMEANSSEIYFYIDSLSLELSLIIHHGKESERYSKSPQIKFKFSEIPNGAYIALSDDLGEFNLTNNNEVCWKLNNGSDGGILGGLPTNSSWSITINPDFTNASEFVKWVYQEECCEIPLNMGKPLNITYYHTICVDNNQYPKWYDATHVKTIQEGVNNAFIGDMVFVYNGVYNNFYPDKNCCLKIEKKINLIGEDKFNTIIDGGYNGNVIVIEADGVEIRNFCIRDSSENVYCTGIIINGNNINIINNNITQNNIGIYLSANVSDNTIEKNEILSNSREGIILNLSHCNNIIENNISKNKYDGIIIKNSSNNKILGNNIFLNYRNGIYSSDSYKNLFIKNTIIRRYGGTNFTTYGIFLSNSSNNEIQKNFFKNFSIGLNIENSNNNNITKNVFRTINGEAIFISNLPKCTDNKIYFNNFWNNAYDENYGLNQWFNETLKSGNYWLNYKGKEIDDTGIGDKRVNITPDDRNNFDKYPLMNPFGKPGTPTKPTGPWGVYSLEKYTYTTHAEAAFKDDNLYYEWNWGDGNITRLGPYKSNETCEASHTWIQNKPYFFRWFGVQKQITVKAINEFEVKSEESVPKEIRIRSPSPYY